VVLSLLLLVGKIHLRRYEHAWLKRVTHPASNELDVALARLHSEVHVDELERQYKVHPLDLTLKQYEARLKKFYDTYFRRSTWQRSMNDPWEGVLAHLYPSHNADDACPFVPDVLVTTTRDKGNITERFATWAALNPQWRIDLMDDIDIERYFMQTLQELGILLPSMSSRRKSRAPLFLSRLKMFTHRILRIDTFRYFRMFFGGGFYVDFDTRCLSPVHDWIGLRSSNDHVSSIASPTRRAKKPQDFARTNESWIPPSIAIEIEFDASIHTEWYRKKRQYARPLQFAQVSVAVFVELL
jgi:hypothetical protein